MSYKLKTIKAFENDVKHLKKKHYNIDNLKEPLKALRENDVDILKTKYSDHSLKGIWSGFRELHVEPDVLLVYRRDEDGISLVLVRLDSHDSLYSNGRVSSKDIRSYRVAVSRDFLV